MSVSIQNVKRNLVQREWAAKIKNEGPERIISSFGFSG